MFSLEELVPAQVPTSLPVLLPMRYTFGSASLLGPSSQTVSWFFHYESLILFWSTQLGTLCWGVPSGPLWLRHTKSCLSCTVQLHWYFSLQFMHGSGRGLTSWRAHSQCAIARATCSEKIRKLRGSCCVHSANLKFGFGLGLCCTGTKPTYLQFSVRRKVSDPQRCLQCNSLIN